MKAIITLIIILISFHSFGRNSGYTEAMELGLIQLNNSKSAVDLKNTANTFNRISNTANQEWLPIYYEAQCYILMSFRVSDKAIKDEYLDIAESRINEILTLQPKNDEAFALQSFMYTARLVIDPMTRGREFSIKSMSSIKTALAFNPNNPRARYLQLSNEVGTANFFGEDPSKYCENILNLLENWDELNTVKDLHPLWGKFQVKGLAENCQTELK